MFVDCCIGTDTASDIKAAAFVCYMSYCSSHALTVLTEHMTSFYNNHTTISDYYTKPVCGDRAILFLKLHGFT